jgi:phospholipase/lecithinase/hemolysin
MKKYIFLLLAGVLFLAAAPAQAQLLNSAFTMTGNGDTIRDSGTKYLTLTLKDTYANVSFQLVGTKLFGTVAGTATLQCSNDGTNYVTVTNAAVFTYTNTATQTTIWEIGASKELFYRIATVGSGTSTYTHKGYVVPRKL